MRLRIAIVSSSRCGATGSSYHASFSGSSSLATRAARSTSKKLWQSTMISTPEPTASRIARVASTPAWTAASMRAAGDPAGGKPSQGAAFSARNPSRTAARADAAKPSGVRGLVARLTLAYTDSRSRTAPPKSAEAGTSSALPDRSHSACSIALNAVACTSPVEASASPRWR